MGLDIRLLKQNPLTCQIDDSCGEHTLQIQFDLDHIWVGIGYKTTKDLSTKINSRNLLADCYFQLPLGASIVKKKK